MSRPKIPCHDSIPSELRATVLIRGNWNRNAWRKKMLGGAASYQWTEHVPLFVLIAGSGKQNGTPLLIWLILFSVTHNWRQWTYLNLLLQSVGDAVTKYRSLSGFCNRNVLWAGSGGCSARERSWQDTALLCILTSSLGLWMAIQSVFLHGSFSMCPCSPCLSVLLPPFLIVCWSNCFTAHPADLT